MQYSAVQCKHAAATVRGGRLWPACGKRSAALVAGLEEDWQCYQEQWAVMAAVTLLGDESKWCGVEGNSKDRGRKGGGSARQRKEGVQAPRRWCKAATANEQCALLNEKRGQATACCMARGSVYERMALEFLWALQHNGCVRGNVFASRQQRQQSPYLRPAG